MNIDYHNDNDEDDNDIILVTKLERGGFLSVCTQIELNFVTQVKKEKSRPPVCFVWVG